MTVQDLIDKLDLIKDKTQQVYIDVEEMGEEGFIDYISHDIDVYVDFNGIAIGGYLD